MQRASHTSRTGKGGRGNEQTKKGKERERARERKIRKAIGKRGEIIKEGEEGKWVKGTENVKGGG